MLVARPGPIHNSCHINLNFSRVTPTKKVSFPNPFKMTYVLTRLQGLNADLLSHRFMHPPARRLNTFGKVALRLAMYKAACTPLPHSPLVRDALVSAHEAGL